jgi:hypothetical protein
MLTPHLTPFGLGGGAGNIGKKDVAKQGGGGSAVSPTLRVNNKLLVMKVKDSVANSLMTANMRDKENIAKRELC